MAEDSKAGGRDAAGDKPGFQPFDPAAIEPYIVKDPEALTVNFARTVEQLGKAASAWLAPRESGEKVDTVAEPMVDMVKTLSKVSEYWLADPRRTLEAQTMLLGSYFNIWSRTLNRLGGQEDEASGPSADGDREQGAEAEQHEASTPEERIDGRRERQRAEQDGKHHTHVGSHSFCALNSL